MKRGEWLPGLLALALLLTGCGGPPEPTPSTILGNDVAQMETARLAEGTVDLRYVGEKEVRIKAQITLEGGVPYNYDLNGAGEWETFAFTQGEGTYVVKVLEQVEGTIYRPVWTQEVTVSLPDPDAPFLHPNQFVNYAPDGQAARQAGEVMASGATDAERVALAFDWVVDALTYDRELSDTVAAGYLPDPDAAAAEGKGICFDYAALLTAMLRSQGIPCRLQVGDAGTTYHAWVEVKCQDAGTVDGAIPLTAGEWSLLDPTFVSSGHRSEKILAYVTDRSNYVARYTY